MKNLKLKSALLSSAALIAVAAAFTSTGSVAGHNDELSSVENLINSVENNAKKPGSNPNSLKTKTPIKHLVVIFNENVSFDHYFGTYPNALNPEGEPVFEPAKKTPHDINNIDTEALLYNNPNFTNALNAPNQSNPFRLDRSQAVSGDQGHAYTPEQLAYDGGKNDLFPLNVGTGTKGGAGAFGTPALVMGYYDGNTVTAFWNYAQNYAMSDNNWTDQFGPSTPGALNMFAGQANGAVVPPGLSASVIPDGQGGFTLINDTDPTGDVCSSKTAQVSFTGKNIGDLLNAANIPWGSFMGGFNLQTVNGNGTSGCGRTTTGLSGTTADYIPHHAWFQYYASTANLNHARPASIKEVGHNGPANHAYDLEDFMQAVGSGNYPAVSFIKLPAYQDGHGGYSNPLDEQFGTVSLINFLQEQEDWDSTAVIIAYDDSDGWYDHASTTITHGSFSTVTTTVRTSTTPVDVDQLNGAGNCGIPGVTPKPVGVSGQPVDGRCGPGTRMPFLVISPYAKKNYVSHTLTTQASIPQFIEDNWLNGQRIGQGSFDASAGSIMDMFDFSQKKSTKLILDPTFGVVDSKSTDKN
ncbi:MAG TPA: alkaline phosphatase family protein [Bradyrhizobium sp.]|uniref:phospholipase C n=1 Tax=Bradyrhizobium sp. TaxID=376 RepID=UPI002D7F68AE|nr:alkaline phosphatase family protein [Bradyrhizobium sp.]HET7889382.1 alkaline phosphatase family protein [Bradyrhizobium sp.]